MNGRDRARFDRLLLIEAGTRAGACSRCPYLHARGAGAAKAGPEGCDQALGNEAIEHGIDRAPACSVGPHRVCPPESRRSTSVSAPCLPAAQARFSRADASFLDSCMRGGCGFDPTPLVRTRSQEIHSGEVRVTML